MELKDHAKDGKPPRVGRIPPAILVMLALVVIVTGGVVMLALALRAPLGPGSFASPPGGLLAVLGVAALLVTLLLVTLLFIVALMALCGGGCGCGCKGRKLPIELIAALLPAVPGGLRAAARAFEAAADATHASIDPLRTSGAALHDTVGPAVAQLQVPAAGLSTKPLWDALKDLHLVHGNAPAFMHSVYVVTSAELATRSPFAGPGRLGTQLTDDGARLQDAGDRAAAVEDDLRAGARGLRDIAAALDGQP